MNASNGDARTLTGAELASVEFAAMRKTCDMCLCYNPMAASPDVPANLSRGQCRRDPPKLTQFPVPLPPKKPTIAGAPPQPEFTEMSLSGWPLVMSIDWCIDGFKPRPEANQ